MITVLFFAKVREDLDCRSLQVSAQGLLTIADLKRSLIAAHGGRWQQVLEASNLICACNQQVVEADSAIKDGDEVAFYPPVTGG
ncbi:molybdopterin synthase subunit MoaD [Sinobacterium caligoides]|uniref:Molybdopterin synthase sulfur carrier subunit n=1 Tax=Sinobacterium caligoides TaxID=933926 RepID=A0A3N2DXQ8_9GAMM|nr:MoaD/ThiS family protein [Sinobacterium caligoides]ROS04646.1 molybdopterin synthase subunit MoaD [Sinobacterium caligoides]